MTLSNLDNLGMPGQWYPFEETSDAYLQAKNHLQPSRFP